MEKNPEKVKEGWQKYWTEKLETINEKRIVYNQFEVDIALCVDAK